MIYSNSNEPLPFNISSGVNVESEARKIVDSSWDSPFHTLGKGATQAAPGNHKHTAEELPKHLHAVADVLNLEALLAAKAASSHTHTGYATTSHTHTGYAASSHTHEEYATTTWTDAHARAVAADYTRGGTIVTTTNASGHALIYVSNRNGVPMIVNGDYGAMARAPHISSWGSDHVWIVNLNASAAVRLNWMACGW